MFFTRASFGESLRNGIRRIIDTANEYGKVNESKIAEKQLAVISLAEHE